MGAPKEKENAAAKPKSGWKTPPRWQEIKLIILVGLIILIADQATKQIIMASFEKPNNGEEVEVVKGFFDLVYRTNDGAAFSIMSGKNNLLAIISLFAAGALVWFREHFDNGTRRGKIALGLLLGGILGNLIDRIAHGSVVDFVRIYIEHRGGDVSEWPAFNIADSAICGGVAILFKMAWSEQKKNEANGNEEETETRET